MLGFILGTYMEYGLQNIALLSIPIIFMCVFVFIPDSPTNLMRMNKTESIQILEKSRKFYGTPANLIQIHESDKPQTATKLKLRDFCNKWKN